MGSRRLPGKVLADVGGQPLLALMLDRIRTQPELHPVVATSTLERDDPIAALAVDLGVPLVRGAEQDVLGRFATALQLHPATDIVRLTGDCPLMDPAIIADAVRLHRELRADYTSNVFPRTFPKGLDVEVIRSTALHRADAEATAPAEREHVTPYLYRHPELFQLANLRSGRQLGDERWTVDTAEDLEVVRGAVQDLGEPHTATWQDVLTVVGRRPREPAGLHLRNPEHADSASVLLWRNDPEAVRLSVVPDPITEDAHAAWFGQLMLDPSIRLWIVETDGDGVGYVRMSVEDAVGTVSVAIDAGHRGRGYASASLDALTALVSLDYQVDQLRAVIRHDNPSSRRAFEKAGYARAGGDDSFEEYRRRIDRQT